MIARYLDRDDIKAMRLVNREFNMKLVIYFLRQVVIHLGPELGTKLGTGVTLQDGPTKIDLTSRLLDSEVFRSFGPDISRFGLSLELDESELATPKIEDWEEINVRHWGIYRWPTRSDARTSGSSSLEEITKSLENYRGILRLVSRVKNIRELALSCEGGLGYLQAPTSILCSHRDDTPYLATLTRFGKLKTHPIKPALTSLTSWKHWKER